MVTRVRITTFVLIFEIISIGLSAQSTESVKYSYYLIKADKLDLKAVDSFPQKIVKIIENPDSYEVQIQNHSTNLPVKRLESTKALAYHRNSDYPVEIAKYLQSTDLIECNSPEIARLADSLIKEISSTYKVIEVLLKFVSSSVKYDKELAGKISNGEHSTKSALVTLYSKKGTCSEYTNLFLALIRNAGIPGKFIIGRILLPDGDQIYHAWAECYTEGIGWMPVEVQNGNTWIPDWGIRLFAGRDFKDCNITLPHIQANIVKIAG